MTASRHALNSSARFTDQTRIYIDDSGDPSGDLALAASRVTAGPNRNVNITISGYFVDVP